MQRTVFEVDVFETGPFTGNPVAVVLGGDGLADAEMARIAHWLNYSETVFVLAPTDPTADYAVRIFTPSFELPFAGHPTLGTAHSWLEAGGVPKGDDVVQECGIGLVRVREVTTGGLAFAAPPLIRSGPPTEDELAEACRHLRVEPAAVLRAEWVDNGPGWLAVELATVDEVLAVAPAPGDGKVGVIARCPADDPDGAALEVRGFFPKDGATTEDPVTGSLNASLADWLVGDGTLAAPYRARQGTALGRHGIVTVTEHGGVLWVGGATSTRVRGDLIV